MPPRIGHLDADCFYVSCERVRHAFLRGVPVGVLSNQGACVIAKSYEMKARGMPTGMPIWEAAPLCPEAVFVKRDFEWYEVLSRRMLGIVRETSPSAEFYSIDEAFFDAREMGYAEAKQLQARILAEVGVPVSVGISLSKTLAKFASSAGKPFGCTEAVTPEAISALLAGRPVAKITGVARRSARRLEGYGIRTCDQFVQADRRLIRRLLTKRGEDLWWELNGSAVLPIQTTRVAHKNISRGGSLGIATADPARLTGWVARNAERLVEALDHYAVYCESLTMQLQFKDGRAYAAQSLDSARQMNRCATKETRQTRLEQTCLPVENRTSAVSALISMPYATAEFKHIHEGGLQLLKRCWRPGAVVSYMHLIAGDLSVRTHAQRGLFDMPDERQKALANVKRRINERVGRCALRSGATLTIPDLYADTTNSYDVCDIYGKTCF